MKSNLLIKIAAISLIVTMWTACEDFITIDEPKTEIVSNSVFETDGAAALATRGIYSLMMSTSSFTWSGMEEYAGIASDELISYSTRDNVLQFYQNNVNTKNTDLQSIFWSQPYKFINNANSIIENVALSSGMTAQGKNQAEGEAKFIRAFCHFYLNGLFGEVPYLKNTDYRINSKAARNSQQEIFQSLEADLLDARRLLPENYSISANARIQPNKFAATALLARVYLFNQEWEKAATMASEVIANANYALLTDLDQVFLANSKETIWQLQPVIPGANTPMGSLFILTAEPNSSTRRVAMTPQMSSAFELNDARRTKWTRTFTSTAGTWNYFYKYKVISGPPITEYTMVLRLAEQYLIRAEARAYLSQYTEALADINVIRKRAGLADLSFVSREVTLNAIEQERRVELFGEFGHRWMDLIRTDRATTVLGAIKPQWQSTDKFFPIPDAERLLNPALTQNEGY